MHSVSFFVQLFCFLRNFGITSLALNTVSHFVSVFEYGCENEGLNHIRVLIHLLRKSFDSETIDDEKSRAKQGFIIRIRESKHTRS